MPFNPNEEETEDIGDYVPLSLIVEEILLQHYYLLTKRGVYKGTDHDFDELDTYRMYTLLDWENQAIAEELRQMEEAENKNKGKTGKRFNVEDDPTSVNLVDRLTDRDLDE